MDPLDPVGKVREQKGEEGEEMFYELELNKPLDQVQEAFKKAVEDVNFAVLHHYHLSQKLKDKGHPIEGELFIYDICNPSYAQPLLKNYVSFGCLIPCRVSIYHENGKTKVSFLVLPDVLKSLKERDPKVPNDLEPAIQRVDEAIRKIMDYLKAME